MKLTGADVGCMRRNFSREYVEIFQAGRNVWYRYSSCVIINRLKHEIGDVQKLSHYFVWVRVLI